MGAMLGRWLANTSKLNTILVLTSFSSFTCSEKKDNMNGQEMLIYV